MRNTAVTTAVSVIVMCGVFQTALFGSDAASSLQDDGIESPVVEAAHVKPPTESAPKKKESSAAAKEAEKLLAGKGLKKDKRGVWRPHEDHQFKASVAKVVSVLKKYKKAAKAFRKRVQAIAKVDKQLGELRKQAESTNNRQIIEQYNNLNAKRRAMHEAHHQKLEAFYAVDAKLIEMLNATAQLMAATKKRYLELGNDKSVLPAIEASGGKLGSAPDTPGVVLRARKEVARTRKELGS